MEKDMSRTKQQVLEDFEDLGPESLTYIADLSPRPKPPVASTEPEVEKDSLGRPITEAQRRYREYEEWSNSPDTSAAMIAQRRRTEPKYAQFYSEQSARERAGGV